MLEIVQDILAAEGKAEIAMQQAKDESTKIRAEADAKAESMLRDAKEEARKAASKRLEEVRTSVGEEFARDLEEEERRIEAFSDTHQDQISRLVDDIVQMVASVPNAAKR